MKGKTLVLDQDKRLPKQQADFLRQDQNMAGLHLGACLDSCRWGSAMTVMYEMTILEMIDFVQNWMKQNEMNYTELWHEYSIEQRRHPLELPYINRDVCPRHKEHVGTFTDLGGRVRCGHVSVKNLKPNFVHHYESIDELSGVRKGCLLDNPPIFDGCEEEIAHDEELAMMHRNYLRELEAYRSEITVAFQDVCYAIMSDKGRVLSLETILKRLNLMPATKEVKCQDGELLSTRTLLHDKHQACKRLDLVPKEFKDYYASRCGGHTLPYPNIEFPFDGWTLAHYVRKWYDQVASGKSPVFEKDQNGVFR